MSKPAIVFIGFMGAGKSWTAATVDGIVGPARDIDDVVKEKHGLTPREFFDNHGEEEFRRVEEEAALSVLGEADGGAVALGGGTVLSERVRDELARHTVVWLEVKADTAWARVKDSDRPLARDRERFNRLFDERRPIYEALADVIVMEGDPRGVERAVSAIQALDQLPDGSRMLLASSDSGEYPVFVGKGLLEAGEGRWGSLDGRRFCVSDATVAGLYGDLLGPLEALVEVDPGESSKTMAEAERVLRDLARAGMTREDHLVALGGGVVGDLAGLCAHLYQRGVPVVQVPTTVVAQVDSAYGGKTGVDLPEGKNYAGAYHLPAAVIADTSTLATLPPEELAAGFVEVIKTGLLAGGELWERVRGIEEIDSGDLDEIVFACARYKCEVVAADERDGGRRHVLNLGHTVGHAIEVASSYSHYRHGEAVGFGLIAALRLSDAPELAEEVEAILARFGLPVGLDPAIEVDAVIDALQRDKKRTAAGVGFVLLSTPGEPREGQVLDPVKVRVAVEELYG